MTNLEKYYYNRITPDELEQVRAEENAKSDEELYNELRALWQREMTSDEIDSDDDSLLLTEAPSDEPVRHHRTIKIALWVTSIAACILLIFAVNTHLDFASYRSNVLAQQVTVTTRPGEQATVTLPDGTNIRLNGGSRLTYPSVFSDTVRLVSLTGEGYFTVAHNEKQPFVVSSNGVEVKVLGTEFDFRCHDGEDISRVVLYNGSVKLTATKTGESATLHPNESAEVNLSNGLLSVSKIDDRQNLFDAWTKHQLVYNNTPLHDVLKSVATNYNLKLVIRPSVGNSRFNGTLPDNHLEEVIETLEVVYKMKIKVVDDKLIVEKR